MKSSANPSVSVLVSSYNYAGYVVEAIESALNQSVPPQQIIVVDDGSHDNSWEVLNQHFATHSQVQLIQQENAGQLAAWRRAFNHATSEIITFLDSDDLWEPNYLASISEVYNNDKDIDFIYTNMQVFGQKNHLKIPAGPDRDLGVSALLGAYYHLWQGTATSALSLRRPWLERLFAMPEDMAIEWKSRPDDCLVNGSDILGAHKYYLAKPLVLHREHGNNALNTYRKSHLVNYRYMMRGERMLEYYRQQAGIQPRWLRLAKTEFRTKPRPTFTEFRAYSWLLWQAPMSLLKRGEHWFSMLKYYWRNR